MQSTAYLQQFKLNKLAKTHFKGEKQKKQTIEMKKGRSNNTIVCYHKEKYQQLSFFPWGNNYIAFPQTHATF